LKRLTHRNGIPLGQQGPSFIYNSRHLPFGAGHHHRRVATHLGIAGGARTPRSATFEFREFAEVGGLMSYGIDPLVQDSNLQGKAACGFLNVPQLALSRSKVIADEVIDDEPSRSRCTKAATQSLQAEGVLAPRKPMVGSWPDSQGAWDV
jgi:hypothetical protein